MSRPFFKTRIDDLEAAFDRGRNDPEFLRKLIDELSHRSTGRAGRLKARAVQALATLRQSSDQHTSAPGKAEARPSAALLPPTPVFAVEPTTEPKASARKPMPPINNSPHAVLSAWTALEVLSPPSFQRPEDLASGDKRAVARLDRGALPWEGNGEKARPHTQLYYQIVLGTIALEGAVAKLMDIYTYMRVERPAARGEAVLAVILVDREGRPIEAPAAAISSFGWAVPRALSGDLETLGTWATAEKPLIESLDRVIRQEDHNGDLRPLDSASIRHAYNWLVSTLGLPADVIKPPTFAIRTYEYFKNSEPPEPLLLNSFFLTDLALAARHFRRNVATGNLKRYLGVVQPETRRDLLHDQKALASAIRPTLFSPARWPGPGRHPLVVLQQAAVNLALHEPRESGILAINGPPGMGKTTLLRDIVAALVVERARVMAGFDDPSERFHHEIGIGSVGEATILRRQSWA